MNSINNIFWEDPPWGDGKQKYRLGLKPIERDKWLNRKPNETLYNHKKNLLDTSYNKVIATTKYSLNAQKHLADIFEIKDFDPKMYNKLSIFLANITYMNMLIFKQFMI